MFDKDWTEELPKSAICSVSQMLKSANNNLLCLSNVLLANKEYSVYCADQQMHPNQIFRICKLNPVSPEDEFMRSLFIGVYWYVYSMCSCTIFVVSSQDFR